MLIDSVPERQIGAVLGLRQRRRSAFDWMPRRGPQAPGRCLCDEGRATQTVVVYVKMMRGAMVRQAPAPERAEDLFDFEYERAAPPTKNTLPLGCGASI